MNWDEYEDEDDQKQALIAENKRLRAAYQAWQAEKDDGEYPYDLPDIKLRRALGGKYNTTTWDRGDPFP